jgi:uncharacterized membrane protein YjjP (DUF1212 family)
VSISLQELKAIIFGAALLDIRENISQIVLVPLTVQPVLHSLLVTIIMILVTMIHYGMASSVKVPAALVPTLPHGSIYSFLLQQQTQFK